jgi:hypothetical protein
VTSTSLVELPLTYYGPSVSLLLVVLFCIFGERTMRGNSAFERGMDERQSVKFQSNGRCVA